MTVPPASLLDPVRALRAALSPAAVAIVGASRTTGKMGNVAVRALTESGFGGRVYPVNAAGGEVAGLAAYRDIGAVPEAPDFAIITVPQPAVAAAVRACAIRGIGVIQILTSGYGEISQQGKDAEQELREIARQYGSRIIGPNCVGTYSAAARLTWTPQADFTAGAVSFISQSGGLAYDLLSSGHRYGLAFDKIISVGNCADLDVGDFLRYLREEQTTRVAGLYVEGPRVGRAMFEELRKLAAVKPVLVLKGGRSDRASSSVSFHTGRLAGSYQVWRGAIRQAGAIEVTSMAEMIAGLVAAQSLPQPTGPRVALVGNGGGATVLAADACAEHGLQIATLTPAAASQLAGLTAFGTARPGAEAIIELPIDQLLSDDGRPLAAAVTTLAGDVSVDAVILNINLVPLVDRGDVAAVMGTVLGRLGELRATGHRPVLTVLRTQGDPRLAVLQHDLAAEARRALGSPACTELEEAVAILATATRIRPPVGSRAPVAGGPATATPASTDQPRNGAGTDGPPAGGPGAGWAESVAGPPPVPGPVPDQPVRPAREAARELLGASRARGDAALDEHAAKALVAGFGLATPPGIVVARPVGPGRPDAAAQPDEPAARVAKLRRPLAVKALTRTPLHKTDAGAVRLGIESDAQLASCLQDMDARLGAAGIPVEAYLVEEQIPSGTEIIIGSIADPTFGRVVLAGLGGTLVETLGRTVTRLCPITAADAADMIAELGAGELLDGRGRPPGPASAALAGALQRIAGPGGLLMTADGMVSEVDLNPVIISGSAATVVDARIALRARPVAAARTGGTHE